MPDDEQVFLVGDGDAGQRLDVFLAERLRDVSRSQLQRLIGTQSVTVNGAPVKSSYKAQSGDLVAVETPAPKAATHLSAETIPLDIVYEDSDLLVIDKAAGMVVHPAPGSENGTLVNALLAHCDDLSGIGGVERPGIVHRLDKDTTGLLVVAKNDAAHHGLQDQIQRRTATRKYLALVWGRVPFPEGIVDVPIGRHPTDRKRMTVADPSDSRIAGRSAITELRRVEEFPLFTLLDATLQTGRTHQIRVHCAFAGFPVVGDPIYGGQRKVSSDQLRGAAQMELNDRIARLPGQALHAYSLAFDHPRTGERLQFEVPPHAEMAGLLDLLRHLAANESKGKKS